MQENDFKDNKHPDVNLANIEEECKGDKNIAWKKYMEILGHRSWRVYQMYLARVKNYSIRVNWEYYDNSNADNQHDDDDLPPKQSRGILLQRGCWDFGNCPISDIVMDASVTRDNMQILTKRALDCEFLPVALYKIPADPV